MALGRPALASCGGATVLRVTLCPRKRIKRPCAHTILHIFRSRRFLVSPANLSAGPPRKGERHRVSCAVHADPTAILTTQTTVRINTERYKTATRRP